MQYPSCIQDRWNMPLLNRIGNKAKIAHKIIPYFPPMNTYAIYREPFFGAGGMFFAKPRSKHNFLNDLDGDVINLYDVAKNFPDELDKEMWSTPLDERLWKRWQTVVPEDPIEKAVRFLFLSNAGYVGQADTLHLTNSGAVHVASIELKSLNLARCKFTGTTAIVFLKKSRWTPDQNGKVFTYCDPPYIGTGSNYSDKSWSINDLEEMLGYLVEEGERFALSEFENPEVDDLCRGFGLKKVIIGERQTMKNRNVEVLWMNYDPPQENGQVSLF